MDEEREVMARNTLFLAVTRPALFAGIPIEAAVVILLSSVISLIFLWGRTKAANRNRVFWGGSSYTPLPLKGIKRKGFGRNG